MQDNLEVLRLGLFEISPDGKVLYYKPEGPPRDGAEAAVGRNLFAEVISPDNAREFQDLLHNFTHGREPSRSVEFTFLFGATAAPARLLLARMREQTNGEGRDSIFVHIRKA
ncbi:MAG TPA: PAS domain-containing protein [Pyrinomonadaceae bacterium]|nr:PAS domain-containing protein [Pyrinomonadaceae bacterium]